MAEEMTVHQPFLRQDLLNPLLFPRDRMCRLQRME